MNLRLAGLALSAALLSSPALAATAASSDASGISGAWRVQGTLSGVAFLLDCHFVPQPQGFGGVCVGAPKGDPRYAGKTYKIAQGAVTGNRIGWSYPSHYLFVNFQVRYLGTLAGNQIAGGVTAAGRSGNFTAARE